MPYRTLNLSEVAEYLHLAVADIERLVKDAAIPFERRGDRTVFRRRDVDAWASQRILGLQDRRLAEYHRQSTRGTRAVFPSEAIMPDMLRPDFIDPAMTAKTRASVVRHLVTLAARTGRVPDPRELLGSLEARETLCSTAVPGGLALLHPRHHQPYMFESSFLVLGRTVQDIPFGAPDGQHTTLFFLICCQDDRIHLHTLARLCLMAQKTRLLARLREAADAASLYDAIVTSEREVLGRR
jgi:excisionase family DNA binding protein